MSASLSQNLGERQPGPDDDWTFTNVRPSSNWRPGQRRQRGKKSVSHTIRHGVCSMLRSVSRRDDFDLPNLAELAAVEDELQTAIRTAIQNLREQGHSWAAIGEQLGTTRQSAFERWRDR